MVLPPFRATIRHVDERQRSPKGWLPSGQAAMLKLVTTMNLTFLTFDLAGDITPIDLYTEKKLLCDDKIFGDKSGF